MITFLTLFLGLIHGLHAVDLSVAPAVVAVEVQLDGRTVGNLTAPPWRLMVDFGMPPEAHELVAVAYDAQRKEVGRAVQKINLPRANAEANLVLLPGSGGRARHARLTWQSATSPVPSRIAVSFDGKPILVPDPSRIALPAFVPEQLHFLRAELDFPDNVAATSEITFGGQHRDETEAQLTAVAVFAKKTPRAEAMQGWFRASGQPARVAAVEEGPGEIVIVLDEAARPAFKTIAAEVDRNFDPWRSIVLSESSSTLGPLRRNQLARFVWPLAASREHAGAHYEVFPRSEDIAASDGGLLWAMLNGHPPSAVKRPHMADAAAVAGLSALSRNRARAVLVVLGGSEDASDISAAAAAHYLASVNVPLYVWRTGEASADAAEAWEPATHNVEIKDLASFKKAADRLTSDVKRQLIVWIEGSHLPQGITLTPAAATGFVLASPVTRPPCTETPGPAEVNVAEGTRIRVSPDPSALALATIDVDVTLRALSRCGDWVQLRWTQFKGWVRQPDGRQR